MREEKRGVGRGARGSKQRQMAGERSLQSTAPLVIGVRRKLLIIGTAVFFVCRSYGRKRTEFVCKTGALHFKSGVVTAALETTADGGEVLEKRSINLTSA